MAHLLHDILTSLTRRGDAVAVRWQGDDLSYGELDRRARRVAAGLAAAGVVPGDRVAVGLENSPELVIGLVAVLRLGAVFVPINPLASPDEVEHILRGSGCKLAVLHADHLAAVSASSLPELAARVSVFPEAEALVDDASLPAEAPALIVYTSGTTGKPKGVVLSHRALGSNLATVAAAWQWSAADRLLLTLPCFHLHGLGLGLLNSLAVGSTILLYRRFSAETVLDDLVRDQATMFFGVPTMYNRIVDLPSDGLPAPRLRLWVSGSAPLAAATFEKFRDRFGAEIVERYGMTECLFVLSARLDAPRLPGHVGYVLPGIDCRIVDPERADEGAIVPVADGVEGEILVQGPNLFSGYWRDPEATAATMLDGYLRSGDLAVRDAGGVHRIVGRLSVDIIKTRGFKVGAGEIEDCLMRLAGVQEVAVVGVPDADQGQRIVAALTPSPGASLDEATVRAYARAHLAPHKVPSRIVFVDEIPRTGPGKFKKVELIQRLSNG